jgi:SAM-dependent methyltransferase
MLAAAGEPVVSALRRCEVCGEPALRVLCEARELAAQSRLLARFHAERLRVVSQEQLEERATFTQDDPANLLACSSCGLLVRWPRPRENELRRTYERDEYAPERLEGMVASQRSLYRRKIPLLSVLLGQPQRVLEIGSFVGGFLEAAREAGWYAVGLDPGRQLARDCRQRGLRVIEGTFEDLAARDELFAVDCLAIWNTFDQLADPSTTLALAAVTVRPGGILAIRVPHGLCFERLFESWRSAADTAERRLWEACLAWNNLFSFPYLFGHTLESLRRLIAPYGFERVSARGDLLPPTACQALTPEACQEEKQVRDLMQRRIEDDDDHPGSELAHAPWLDVYWRRL